MERKRIERPEQYTIKLLESKLSKVEDQVNTYREILETKQEQSLFKDLSTHQKQGLLGAIYAKNMNSKSQVVGEIDKIRNSAISSGIVDVLLNDALAPNIATNDIIKISSTDNEVINESLKELQEAVDLDSLVMDIADDLINYGEYIMTPVVEEGKGITAINDNVGQGEVTAIYQGHMPVGYIKQLPGFNKMEICGADDYIHFCLGRSKLRIKLEGMAWGKSVGTRKEYVRIGRSVFYGVLNEINELNLLKSLVPASYVQKINATTLIGISMPENTLPEDAFKICRRYETVLNKLTSFDSSTGAMTVADILNQAGKFKVVPVFGGDKGKLEKMDPRFDSLIDISLLKTLKEDIFGSIGIPYSFIYGGTSIKGTELKQFARYVRKILMIQFAIRHGLIQIVNIHLKAKGQKAAQNSIKVQFTNALISVDELDKIEFLDTLLNSIGTAVSTLNDIALKSGSSVNKEKMQDFVNRFLVVADLSDTIEFPDMKKKAKSKADIGTMGS